MRAGEPNIAQVHGEMQDAPSNGLVWATNHPLYSRSCLMPSTVKSTFGNLAHPSIFAQVLSGK